MYHYIVKHACGSKNQPVIKGECTTGGTASPTALLVTDGDGGESSSGKLMVICNPIGENLTCQIAIAAFKDFETLPVSGR